MTGPEVPKLFSSFCRTAAAPPSRRRRINEYSVTLPDDARHDFICPDFDVATTKPDPRLYPLSFANEPREGQIANCSLHELVFVYDDLDDPDERIAAKKRCGKWGALALYTCSDVHPSQELTWHYGTHYQRRDYLVGSGADLKSLYRKLERWNAVIDVVPLDAVYEVE